MLTLYWGSGSPFAWRVMLALEIKKISYEGKLMSFSSGELRKPEFLSLSPRAQVPLITDGDFALTESLAILQYLESRYPSHVLFGENPEDTGKIWQSIQSTTGYIEASVFNFAKPIFASKLEELGGQVIIARKNLEEELSRVERELSATGYLSGDAITTSDISLYPLLQYMSRAANKVDADIGGKLCDLPKNFVNIFGWNSKIEALPGFDKTYPPHWK